MSHLMVTFLHLLASAVCIPPWHKQFPIPNALCEHDLENYLLELFEKWAFRGLGDTKEAL